ALRGFIADRLHFFDGGSDDRRHAAASDGNGFLHELAAKMNDLRRFARSESADADDRAVLAEGMTGDEIAARDSELFQHRVDRGGDGEDRRLRVLRELQLFIGTFEAELRNREAEGFVDLLENA